MIEDHAGDYRAIVTTETNEVQPGILSSTFHFPEIMLNIITSSVGDSLAIPLWRDRSCPEYKVVIPLGRDKQCRIRKARRTHTRNAGELSVQVWNAELIDGSGAPTRKASLYLWTMTSKVERNSKDQVVITISGAKDAEAVQRLVDYLTYLFATEGSKAKQADVDKIARDAKSAWWKKNKKRYLGEGRR